MTSGYSLYTVDSAFQLHSCSIACNIWNTLGSHHRFDHVLLIYIHLHLSSIYIQSFVNSRTTSFTIIWPMVSVQENQLFPSQGASERQISIVPCADDEAGRPNMPQVISIISPQISTDLHGSPRISTDLHGSPSWNKRNTRNKWIRDYQRLSEMLRALRGETFLNAFCSAPHLSLTLCGL